VGPCLDTLLPCFLRAYIRDSILPTILIEEEVRRLRESLTATELTVIDDAKASMIIKQLK
jgi:hypothetical protein